ncbi:MAG: GNAT family N-acetyltransferase [bacterium]|nr:GNAT family N-acetyltransferase [bacterium]
MLTSDGTSADDTLAAFRQLAHDVYRNDPLWAPQSEDAIDDCLDGVRRGTSEVQFVVATSAGRIEARAAAIHGSDASPGSSSEGHIGLYECLPDAADSGVEVLRHCQQWLHSQGIQRVVAPRIDQLRAGLQVGGFEMPQTIFTAHNPPHYAAAFRTVFSTETRMVGFMFSKKRVPRFRIGRRHGFSVRSMGDPPQGIGLQQIEAFQREVFAGRIGYLPRNNATAQHTASKLMSFVDPDLITIACDGDDQVIGLLICLPDWWQREADPDRARLISVGVAADWRGKSVAMAMGAHLTRVLLEKGYETLEGSWVLESNRRTRHLARLLGAKPGREFALFSSDLT